MVELKGGFKMKTLTFAFDASLGENDNSYIPEGTIVEVYPYNQFRDDSTKIIYNGEVIEYMNYSFVEYRV
jgi:hypothetical protein